jgi:succinate dehydrogenase/fumarate reductase flavoprotein subunit
MLWHGALQMADREADLATDYDVVVIGAGAGGMTAAAVAATRGLRAIVIEKTGVVGGTTAVSGGMVWAPNSTQAAEPQDTPAQAATYLEAVVGSAAGADLRRHYLAEAPKAIDYLERHTRVRLMPVPFYPDYYPDVPTRRCAAACSSPSLSMRASLVTGFLGCALRSPSSRCSAA